MCLVFVMYVLVPLRVQVFMCWHVFGICHVRFVSSPSTSVYVLACVWYLSCTFCFLSVYMCWHVFGICHVRFGSSPCTRVYVLACVWYLSRTNVVLVDTICTACDMSVAF